MLEGNIVEAFERVRDTRYGSIVKKTLGLFRFLTWGLDSDGEGSYTVALIANDEGEVRSIYPDLIKFVGGFKND